MTERILSARIRASFRDSPSSSRMANAAGGEARRRRNLWKWVVHNVPIAIKWINEERLVTYMNRAARVLYPERSDSGRPMRLSELPEGEDNGELYQLVERAFDAGEAGPVTYSVSISADPDGASGVPKTNRLLSRAIRVHRPYSAAPVVVLFQQDLMTGAIVRMPLEQRVGQVLNQDQSEEIRALGCIVLHEVRQPLFSAKSFLFAISRKAKRERALIEGAQRQFQRIEDILASAFGEAGNLSVRRQIFCVSESVRETLLLVKMDARLRDISLRAEFFPKKLYVEASRTQVTQVIVNLVVNAFDALDASAASRRKKVVIKVGQEDRFAVVSVRDNGVGLEQMAAQDLVLALRSAKPQGTGLGLTICREIAARYGGSLRAEPIAEGGASFSLYLPLKRLPG